MLLSIGSVEHIPSFIEQVKAKKVRLMGFGHRVYKNYDPRAKIIRRVAEDVFSILGKEPLIDVAMALEKVALEDPYFIQRKRYHTTAHTHSPLSPSPRVVDCVNANQMLNPPRVPLLPV